MADELSVKATVAYTVSNVQLFQKQWNVDQDKTDQYFENGVVATSTTPSQLSIASGTAGYVIIKNLSTTGGETVHVQTTSTSGVGDHRFATLPIDGGICIYPLKASGAVWLQAATGTPKVEYAILST